MQYKCIASPGAAPCISDTRFDRDGRLELIYRDGTIGGKVVRTCKHVKKGKVVRWVDPSSRKHFIAVDDEARKCNELDREFLLKELSKIVVNGKKLAIPPDATLSELGATYNKFDPRMAKVQNKRTKSKSRIFGFEEINADESGETVESLKSWLDEHDVKYHHKAGIDKLRELKEETIKKADANESEEQ